jgi:hypothetical protein
MMLPVLGGISGWYRMMSGIWVYRGEKAVFGQSIIVASLICDETNLSNIADFRVSGESFWIYDPM